MKKTVALLCSATLTASLLVACTPKPLAAEPVAEELISALESRNDDALKDYVDDPATTTEIWNDTYDGLQAEGVDMELTGVDQQQNTATARYSVTWDLPRDRELHYDTSMTLTKAGDKWTARWQPSMIHPGLGAHQHLELRAVEAKRASVVSSDGVELMAPGVNYRLLVDKDAVGDVRAAAAQIASAVNAVAATDESVEHVDARELADSLDEAQGSYSVAMFSDKAGQALEGKLSGTKGIRLNKEPALVATEHGFATDIMSRVRAQVNDELEGTNGWSVSVVNQEGAELSDIEHHDPVPAPAIKVSIDSNVQRAAEEAVNLRAGSEAMMVAIRPSTGEILAVAQTENADKLGDVALQGQYPPGSVFKIITASAGVAKQGLDPDSIVPCPGTMDIYGRIVTNYNSFALGNVPLAQAFAQSCNTTFANISTELDKGALKSMAESYGLGLDYKIPGLTTMTGTVPEGETELERTESGYGQGLDLASPFGMAIVSATVAAGTRPTPQLISTHKTEVSANPDGPSPAVIDNLRTMMRKTVTSGTARGMKAGGTIYGKTGEAEVNGGSHAWFTGFRDDDIAFATLVPMGGGSETSVALTDAFFQNLDRLRTQAQP